MRAITTTEAPCPTSLSSARPARSPAPLSPPPPKTRRCTSPFLPASRAICHRNTPPSRATRLTPPRCKRQCADRTLFIAIHRKPHTVLRRFAVQPRTVFGDAPCLKLSVDGYIIDKPKFCFFNYLLPSPQPSPTGRGSISAVLPAPVHTRKQVFPDSKQALRTVTARHDDCGRFIRQTPPSVVAGSCAPATGRRRRRW